MLLALALGLAVPVVLAEAVAPMVGTSGNRTCALASGGEVFCWGQEFQNRAGVAERPRFLLPTRVQGLPAARRLAVGTYHACAVAHDDGRLWCWGEGVFGNLGFGDNLSSFEPRPVPDITNAVDVAVGLTSTCVLLADGRVLCWGGNYGGALGDGQFASTSRPGRPVNVPPARALVVPIDGLCVITLDDELWCWGGQVPPPIDPTPQAATVPVHIKDIGRVTEAFGVLDSIICARRVISGWLCVRLGRLIDAQWHWAGANPAVTSTFPALAFASSVFVPPATTAGVLAPFYGYGRETCGLLASGALCAQEWNVNDAPPDPARGVSQVFALHGFCTLHVSGHLRCGGDNRLGQLGLGHTSEVADMQLVRSPDGRDFLNLWTHAPSRAVVDQAHAALADLEARFGAELPTSGGTVTTLTQGLLVRHYPQSQAYLGVSVGAPEPRRMYLGPASHNTLIDLGPLPIGAGPSATNSAQQTGVLPVF